VFSKKEQAKLEPIQVFLEDQALSESPASVVPRQQCREWKVQRLGYFISSGKQFRLADILKPLPPVAPVSSRFGAVHDESANPGDDTTHNYAEGKWRARAIVDAGWVPRNTSLVLCSARRGHERHHPGSLDQREVVLCLIYRKNKNPLLALLTPPSPSSAMMSSGLLLLEICSCSESTSFMELIFFSWMNHGRR
jgi:hypothetical protein